MGDDRGVRSWQLGLRAIDRLETLSNGCDFARRPSLYLASSLSDVKGLRAEHELRRASHFDVAWLDRRP